VHSHRFLDTITQSFVINSGVSAWTQTLSSITGNVSHLFFVIRTSTATGTSKYAFQACSTWELLDPAGANMTGGQLIQYNNSMYHLSRRYVDSSYLTESGANVFIYSFAEDPSHTQHTGMDTGHRRFTGSEKLRINFASSISSAYTVEVFGYVHALLHVSSASVRKEYE
jgi:hypothetical protein